MGPILVVIVTPGGDLLASALDRGKHVCVQALVAQQAVDRFDDANLERLAGTDEVESHASAPGPLVKRPGIELRAIVHGDCSWHRTMGWLYCFGLGACIVKIEGAGGIRSQT